MSSLITVVRIPSRIYLSFMAAVILSIMRGGGVIVKF